MFVHCSKCPGVHIPLHHSDVIVLSENREKLKVCCSSHNTAMCSVLDKATGMMHTYVISRSGYKNGAVSIRLWTHDSSISPLSKRACI